MTAESFVAIVLAAGRGTRMRSARPKVLHPLAGRPLLTHLLASVAPLGPARIMVVVAPGMEEVAAVVAPIECVVQPQQLGSADAVKAAAKAFPAAGTVLVLYGDTPLLGRATLERVLAARMAAPKPGIVVLGFRPADPGAYGRLVTDASGGLQRIVEAADASEAERAIPLCNSGVMAIDAARLPQWLARVGRRNAQSEYYLPDLVAIARAEGAASVVVEGPADELLGVNSRAELAAAEAVVQRGLRAAALEAGATLLDPATVWFSHDTRLARDVTVHPSVFFGPGVSVAEGAVIYSFSHLEGASIGAGARVGPFARLRPGSQLGPDVHLGSFVETKKTNLGAGAKANHLAYLGDSTIGAGANIGAGTVICNYDGFDKHATEIGAGAFIGSNSSLIAPLSIGAGAVVGAGSVITKDVPADALALARAPEMVREGWAAARRKRRQKPIAGKH